ncbi:MAG TPA: LPS export ABC transporter periplasmic protein LptC [Longimicrobiaceae bacterium]|nr:LPS export ABC transporter periplasmic protein LptC [Longimicrobiaceae bacterium]
MPRLALSLLLVPALLLAGCRRETTVPTRQDRLAAMSVDGVMYGLEHVMTTSGVRKANLHGDTAYFRDSDSQVDLRGVKLDFFNEATGAVAGTLTSKAGRYDMRTGAMTATGDAVLTLQGADGTRVVSSEELNYDVQANRVWSDKPTVMKENGREVRGASFESDTKFQNLTVRSARASGPAPSGDEGEVRF